MNYTSVNREAPLFGSLKLCSLSEKNPVILVSVDFYFYYVCVYIYIYPINIFVL